MKLRTQLTSVLVLALAILCVAPLASLGAYEVVATHSVLGEIAKTVGGEYVDVVTIIPSGFCPAHYDLAPSDFAALLHAHVVFYSGFEPWVERLSGSTKEGALVQLRGSWNTPADAIEKTNAVAQVLAERIPEGAATFAANAEQYVAKLQAVSDELQRRAAEMNVSVVPVVCMEWQVSFVKWLGFQAAVTYGMPEGLSLRDLVQLAETGRAVKAVLVIDNLQSGIEFGAKLAREVGAVHVVLSNFPGALPKTATLIDTLRRNADALLGAIQPVR
ncbi:MAG: metal ABC transporter substrate-binding protein [Candidatus Bipolaricaulis sp.]|nr:metal ABC transporter substrate-binding protein [Candidatus Bipolaricaulis sp.]